jgi:hypothetical protein
MAVGGTLAAGPRFGVRSMSAPLRRVMLRRPSVTGVVPALAWTGTRDNRSRRHSGRCHRL